MLHSNIHNYISRPGLPNDERRRVCMCVLYVCYTYTLCHCCCKANPLAYPPANRTEFHTLFLHFLLLAMAVEYLCAPLLRCKKQCYLIPFFSLSHRQLFSAARLAWPCQRSIEILNMKWSDGKAPPHHLFLRPIMFNISKHSQQLP